LGLAAVFAVSKTVKSNEKPEERKRTVLIATGEIMPGELIQESRVGVKAIPESAAPPNCIDAANKAFTLTP
jgi:Flp pilus assembly protein CpaB